MPKFVDHAARRAEIAAAAADAIDEQGLESVRLVDVARRAACTTGAVGHYFGGKDAVLAAALEHVLGRIVSYFPRSRARRTGDCVDRFVASLAEILPLDDERRGSWRVWMAFCGRAVSTPALAQLHRAAYAEIQQALASDLCRELALGEVAAHDLAVAIVAALDGIGLRASLEPDEWPASRLRAQLALQLDPLLRSHAAIEVTRSLHPQALETSV